jgi:micrococcal nuclease
MSLILACMLLVAYDGDTPRCDGQLLRDMGSGAPFISGFDTPELSQPKCQQELELARAAKARYQELLDTGVTVLDSGERDRYGRPLVSVRLRDGRFAGDILIAEGHARPWFPNVEHDWCG